MAVPVAEPQVRTDRALVEPEQMALATAVAQASQQQVVAVVVRVLPGLLE